MKTAFIVLGVAVTAYVVVRMAKAIAAGGTSPIVAVLHPNAPIIQKEELQKLRGAGHF